MKLTGSAATRDIGLALATGVILLAGVCVSTAASMEVADGDVAGFEAAIHAANDEIVHPGADTIVLAVGGVYRFAGDHSGQAALPLVTSQVRIEGNGATLVRDAAAMFRLLSVAVTGDLTLEGVTLTNGYAGIGGAIYSGGHLAVIDSVLQDNRATGRGGAIYVADQGQALLQRVVMTHNSAETDYGGAICVRAGTLLVSESTFSMNEAEIGGGALYATEGSQVEVDSSTLEGNFAGIGGGAIMNHVESQMLLVNTTLSGNHARMGGALVNMTHAQLNIVSSTLTGNRADLGATAYGAHEAEIAWVATLIAEPAGVSALCVGGGFAGAGGTLATDTSCGGDFVSYAELALGPLAANGGPTRTHALLAGSRAIDSPFVQGAAAVDQRGFARPMDGDNDLVPLADVGAYEHENLLLIDVAPETGTSLVALSRDHVDVLVKAETLGLGMLTMTPEDLAAAQITFGDNLTAPRIKMGQKNQLAHHLDGTGLLLHFDTAETGLEPTDTEACLTMTLGDGRAFRGCDAVTVAP